MFANINLDNNSNLKILYFQNLLDQAHQSKKYKTITQNMKYVNLFPPAVMEYFYNHIKYNYSKPNRVIYRQFTTLIEAQPIIYNIKNIQILINQHSLGLADKDAKSQDYLLLNKFLQQTMIDILSHKMYPQNTSFALCLRNALTSASNLQQFDIASLESIINQLPTDNMFLNQRFIPYLLTQNPHNQDLQNLSKQKNYTNVDIDQICKILKAQTNK